MEVLVEVLFELVGTFLLLAIGYVGGSVVYVLFRAARSGIRQLDEPEPVTDPSGRQWSVRVALAPAPLRYTVSRWYFRMRHADQRKRRSQGITPDDVGKAELAHPSGFVEQFEEASGIFVWAFLAVTIVALTVLLLEVLVVALVAAVVLVVRSVRGGWQCVVVGPEGQTWHVRSEGRLADARTLRDSIRDELAAGAFEPPRVGT